MKNVVIIGAGHVGCALAYDLISRGHEALLRSVSGHPGNLPVNGNILKCRVILNGQVPIKLEEGLGNITGGTQSVIIVAIPSQGHDPILAEISRADLSNTIIVFITGNAVGIKARHTLDARAVLDTSTSPYSSRVDDNGRVTIRGMKRCLQIGSLAPGLTEEDLITLGDIFRMPLDRSPTILERFFSGVNGVVHVPTALMNLGWIESTDGDFLFYRQGMNSSVCAIIEAADRERVAVAKAYRCKIDSALDTYN